MPIRSGRWRPISHWGSCTRYIHFAEISSGKKWEFFVGKFRQNFRDECVYVVVLGILVFLEILRKECLELISFFKNFWYFFVNLLRCCSGNNISHTDVTWDYLFFTFHDKTVKLSLKKLIEVHESSFIKLVSETCGIKKIVSFFTKKLLVFSFWNSEVSDGYNFEELYWSRWTLRFGIRYWWSFEMCKNRSPWRALCDKCWCNGTRNPWYEKNQL